MPLNDDELKHILRENTSAIHEATTLQRIRGGDRIPDGFSITDAGSMDFLHIKFQQSLPGGLVVRFRAKIPKVTADKPETWVCEKMLYFEGTEKS